MGNVDFTANQQIMKNYNYDIFRMTNKNKKDWM